MNSDNYIKTFYVSEIELTVSYLVMEIIMLDTIAQKLLKSA